MTERSIQKEDRLKNSSQVLGSESLGRVSSGSEALQSFSEFPGGQGGPGQDW